MDTRSEVLSGAELDYVLSTVRTDMRKLEMLTQNRVQFQSFYLTEEYEWPVVRVFVDNEEERIWYDISDEGTYWCEEMGVSASIIDLARRIVR